MASPGNIAYGANGMPIQNSYGAPISTQGVISTPSMLIPSPAEGNAIYGFTTAAQGPAATAAQNAQYGATAPLANDAVQIGANKVQNSNALTGLLRSLNLGGNSGLYGGGTIGLPANNQVSLPPAVQYQGPSTTVPNVPNVPQVQPVDTTAANSAAFGQAKQQVGDTTSGALASLRSVLAGRGMLGSGAESRGTTNIIAGGQEQLGNVSATQAQTNAQLAQQSALANQQTQLQQAQQSVQAQEAANALAAQQAAAAYQGQISQRATGITAETAQEQMLNEQILQQNTLRANALNGLLSIGGV